jgi:hypothetical protein
MVELRQNSSACKHITAQLMPGRTNCVDEPPPLAGRCVAAQQLLPLLPTLCSTTQGASLPLVGQLADRRIPVTTSLRKVDRGHAWA